MMTTTARHTTFNFAELAVGQIRKHDTVIVYVFVISFWKADRSSPL
jgi:hypothetical protein